MILLRIYFFVGLVAVTIFTILLFIADPSRTTHIDVARWALLGILAACVPILLAVEELFVQKGWLASTKTSNERQAKATLQIGRVSLKSFVIAMFINTIASLVISYLYGEEVFRTLVVERVTLFVVVVFALAMILSFILERMRNLAQ